jgi:hypothetical protein
VAEDKYVYFLLASASAAIFVALQRTSSVGFQESQILLGFAGVCWIGSFVAGCLNRGLKISSSKKRFWARSLAIVRPMAYLEAREKGIDTAKLPELLEMFDELATRDHAASIKDHDTARACYKYQVRLLVLGGVIFVLWHLQEMWRHTL